MRDIDKYAEDYLDNPFETSMIEYRHRKTVESLVHFAPRRILEVGCGQRPLHHYHDNFDTLLIIEPAESFARVASEKSDDRVTVINAPLDRQLAEGTPFDFIAISSLLHEVENPVLLLEEAKAFAADETVFHINVPNANSLHRLLAVRMGLIESVKQSSERQQRFQQHNCFDTASLTELVQTAGLEVINMETFFIKPFTHDQMQSMLDSEVIDSALLDGLYQLSGDLPDMGAEIVANVRLAR